MPREEKQPYLRISIRKNDTLKILLMVLWENKLLDNKKYIAISAKIEEIGKMLGGWNGQVQRYLEDAKAKSEERIENKQNFPEKSEKK